jgi:hypothetical protein
VARARATVASAPQSPTDPPPPPGPPPPGPPVSPGPPPPGPPISPAQPAPGGDPAPPAAAQEDKTTKLQELVDALLVQIGSLTKHEAEYFVAQHEFNAQGLLTYFLPFDGSFAGYLKKNQDVLFRQTSSPSAETAASRGKVWNLEAWRIDVPYDFKKSLPEIVKATQTPIREYMAVVWESEMSKTIMDVLERNCTTLNTIYSKDLEEMRNKPGKIAEEIGRLKPGPINAQISSPGSPEAKQNFEMRIKVLLFLYANANSTLLELSANPEPVAVREFNRMDAFASEVVAWPERTPLLAVHEYYRSSIESKLDHATEGKKTEAELRKAVVGLAPAYKSSLALDLITVLSLVASVPQLSIALEEPDKLANKTTIPKSPKTPEYQPPYVLCGGTPQLLYLEPKNAELKPYQPAMEEYVNLTMKWTYSFIRAMNIVLCLPEDSAFVNDLKPPSKSLAGSPKIEMERYKGLACSVGVIEKILDTYKPGTTVPVIDASFRNMVKEAFKSQVGEGKPFASDEALDQMIAVGAREKWLPLVLLMGAPGVPKNCLGRLKEFNQVFEREGPGATPGLADVVKKVTL